MKTKVCSAALTHWPPQPMAYNIEFGEGNEQTFVIGHWKVPFVVLKVTTQIR
jgi:hypothetical protein